LREHYRIERVGPVMMKTLTTEPMRRERKQVCVLHPMAILRRRASEWMWPGSGVASSGSNRTVVCHEWLTSAAGSDKVAAELVRIVGAEALYCFAARDEVVERLGILVPVYQCRFGRWAASNRRWQVLLPVMPVVWGLLELGDVRLLVTSSHAAVNSIPRSGKRVSYCHTPMRYAWEWRMELQRLPRVLRPMWAVMSAMFRRMDRWWSRRVDVYVANSEFVAERIRDSYGRDSVVVHPPIETDRFVPSQNPTRDAFLVAGRLVPYKRPDLAVIAANRTSMPLIVAGAGPELSRLQSIAGPTVRFMVSPDDDELLALYQNARALVFPGVEDFGMTVVEAQSCGTPVIARAAGGALESVDLQNGGCVVNSDDAQHWADALAHFVCPSDGEQLHLESSRFSVAEFERGIRDVLDAV
jgi:glycosyltransferase involved in cell wall biosynthesis